MPPYCPQDFVFCDSTSINAPRSRREVSGHVDEREVTGVQVTGVEVKRVPSVGPQLALSPAVSHLRPVSPIVAFAALGRCRPVRKRFVVYTSSLRWVS